MCCSGSVLDAVGRVESFWTLARGASIGGFGKGCSENSFAFEMGGASGIAVSVGISGAVVGVLRSAA